MAEQKAESYKKKQEELRVQYEKEQDLYTNKAILSKESKDKLSVNFMYEPPPGTKKEREREDDEPEYKFEWQRKFNAPREDYCKGDSEIRDQPFGIQVRNVRCIKCHKWGHINTDKECPMYNQLSSSDQAGPSLDPLILVQQMREDGLAMKRSALSIPQQMRFSSSRDLIPSEDEDEKSKQSEMEFLKSLTVKQKRRLLRKLEKLEKKDKSSKSRKRKMKKSKQKLKDSESGDTSSCSERSKEERKSHNEKRRVKKDKNKQRERNYKNVAIKKEQSSLSSKSELPNKSLEKVLGRSIDFAGPNNTNQRHHAACESSSDRDYRKTARVIVRGGRSVNGTKHSSEHTDSDTKRTNKGSDSSHRKKQRQYN